MKFLKYNAMQISGLVGATFGTLVPFLHLTSYQTGALTAYPTSLGTFLAGMVINYRNGNGKSPSQPAPELPVHN